MDPKNLFPSIPEDLTQVDVEELQALLDELRASALAIKEGTADLSAFTDPAEVVEQYRAGAVAIRAIENELTERSKGVENFAEALAEVETETGVEIAAVEEPAEELAVEPEAELAAETETEVETETETEVEETVVASGGRRLALPAVAKQHRAMVVELEDAAASFVAAVGLPSIAAGARLDRKGLAEAFIAARSSTMAMPAGFQDRQAVASMDYSHLFPAERRLGENVGSNMALLDAIFGDPTRIDENIVASGGLCAPYTNFYDVVSYGSSARPVRDALVSFNASRGGVNVPGGISIADITDGVGVVTAAQDAAGGTTGTKTCLAISCPSYTPTAIEAIYACIEFGNLNSRAWPELVERFMNELDAQHARVAETELLDGIASASTSTTRALQYSGTSTILAGVLQAVAAYRQRLRMDRAVPFDLLLPDFLPELLLNDLINRNFQSLEIRSANAITGLIESVTGTTVSYYMDAPTNAAATGWFDSSQTAAALDSWPTHIFGYLFPRGTFIHLDMGELNLGLVRDSTLNETNDYQMFRETFENVAFIGIQSLEIDFTVDHSGVLADVTGGTYVP